MELPLDEMSNMGTFEIEARAMPKGADLPHADWRSASPRYFSARGKSASAMALVADLGAGPDFLRGAADGRGCRHGRGVAGVRERAGRQLRIAEC
jgi:hypothetical protein